MKKLLVLLLAAVMAMFVFVGCGKSESKYVSEDTAKKVAVEQVKGASAENVTACELDEEDDINKVYEITIMHEDKQYDIEVNAVDGTLMKVESESVTAGNQPADGEKPIDMGKNKIEKIALKQVKGAEKVDIVKCELDNDDGKNVYEVEIQYGGNKYELEIDATSGKILKNEKEKMD